MDRWEGRSRPRRIVYDRRRIRLEETTYAGVPDHRARYGNCGSGKQSGFGADTAAPADPPRSTRPATASQAHADADPHADNDVSGAARLRGDGHGCVRHEG